MMEWVTASRLSTSCSVTPFCGHGTALPLSATLIRGKVAMFKTHLKRDLNPFTALHFTAVCWGTNDQMRVCSLL